MTVLLVEEQETTLESAFPETGSDGASDAMAPLEAEAPKDCKQVAPDSNLPVSSNSTSSNDWQAAEAGNKMENGAVLTSPPRTSDMQKETADDYDDYVNANGHEQQDSSSSDSSLTLDRSISLGIPANTATDGLMTSIMQLPSLPRTEPTESRQGAFAVGGPGIGGSSLRSADYSITDIERYSQQNNASLERDIENNHAAGSGAVLDEDSETGYNDRNPHHLIEAELVEDAPVIPSKEYPGLVAAAVMEDSSRGCRNRILVAAGILIILALVVAVVALVVANNSGGETRGSSSALDDPTNEVSLPVLGNTTGANAFHQEITDDSVAHDDEEEQGPPFCFRSHEELMDAVDAYYWDNSPTTNVSLFYGWPMGSWCVSRLRDFQELFHTQREHNMHIYGDRDDDDVDVGVGGVDIVNSTNDNVANNATEASTLAMEKIAAYFSHDLGNWDMSKAKYLGAMFKGVQNMSARSWGIERWNTVRATSIKSMFENTTWGAGDESPDLSQWDVSLAIQFDSLFRNSNIRTANIAGWNTGKVRRMEHFTNGAPLFNDDLSRWDTSSVETLKWAFKGARSFNSDLSQWDVSNVQEMRSLFNGAIHFNSDISSWNVSRVENMDGIFIRATSFNQDLSSWDVSRVETFEKAFAYNPSFQQNLCAWGAKLGPTKEVVVAKMFEGTGCPNTSDPILADGGPFCFNCDGSG